MSNVSELAKNELDAAVDVQVLARDRLNVAEEALAKELSRIMVSGSIGTDVAVLDMLRARSSAEQVLHLATALVQKRREDYKAAAQAGLTPALGATGASHDPDHRSYLDNHE